MKLFGTKQSPYARHCRVALHDTNCDFQFVETQPGEPENESPVSRVPFVSDGSLELSDSSSILKYVRERVGQQFCSELEDYELYCLSNSVLDSAMNVFMFLRFDGLEPERSHYLSKQQQRVQSGLLALERRSLPMSLPMTDGAIRLACLVDWGLFRERFGLDDKPRLRDLLALAAEWKVFAKTSPRED